MSSADGVCATHSNRKNNYSYQKKELRSEAGRGSTAGLRPGLGALECA